jgi:hypothetical protein
MKRMKRRPPPPRATGGIDGLAAPRVAVSAVAVFLLPSGKNGKKKEQAQPAGLQPQGAEADAEEVKERSEEIVTQSFLGSFFKHWSAFRPNWPRSR